VPCAPEKLSNRRYYDAASDVSPKWMVNATYWGHVDFMDPVFQVGEGSVHCSRSSRGKFGREFFL